MLESIIALLQEHTWEIATISLAPLMGFIVAQYLKAFIKEKCKAARTKILITSNAIVTGMSAFWTWPGGFEDSLKVSILLAMLGPFIVWLWFTLASRWAPKSISALSSDNEDWQNMTYFNMFKKKD